MLMYFRAEPSVATELDRVMRISEDCIRHIIVLDEGGQAETAKDKLFKLPVLEEEVQEEEEAGLEETEETEAADVEEVSEEQEEAVEAGDAEAEESAAEEAIEEPASDAEVEAAAETGSAESEGEAEGGKE